jgi:hypothetical protein
MQKAIRPILYKHLDELSQNSRSHQEKLKALIFVLVENESVGLASSEILEAAL